MLQIINSTLDTESSLHKNLIVNLFYKYLHLMWVFLWSGSLCLKRKKKCTEYLIGSHKRFFEIVCLKHHYTFVINKTSSRRVKQLIVEIVEKKSIDGKQERKQTFWKNKLYVNEMKLRKENDGVHIYICDVYFSGITLINVIPKGTNVDTL